ncbi:VanZ family protein [Dorea sp. OM02-2LB]|nr:VanZ family protein [Dorea sp. OM02-2LB]
MKHFVTFFLKPLSFLPALVMMYAIYSFSAQTGTESGNLSHMISVKIVETASDTLQKDLDDWEVEELADHIEFYVRKAAHMTEYFLLAIAVSFPLYVYGLRGFPLLLFAGLICVGFACGDEYHQSFVDGRGPSVRDVCIDSVGVFFGIMLVRIVCWTFLAPVRVVESLTGLGRRDWHSHRKRSHSNHSYRTSYDRRNSYGRNDGSQMSERAIEKRNQELLKKEGRRHIY